MLPSCVPANQPARDEVPNLQQPRDDISVPSSSRSSSSGPPVLLPLGRIYPVPIEECPDKNLATALAAMSHFDLALLVPEAHRQAHMTGARTRHDDVHIKQEQTTEVDDILIDFARFFLLKVLLRDSDMKQLSPTPIMEAMWRTAILNTRFYQELCRAVNGGAFIHHTTANDSMDARAQEATRLRRMRRMKEEYRALYQAEPLEYRVDAQGMPAEAGSKGEANVDSDSNCLMPFAPPALVGNHHAANSDVQAEIDRRGAVSVEGRVAQSEQTDSTWNASASGHPDRKTTWLPPHPSRPPWANLTRGYRGMRYSNRPYGFYLDDAERKAYAFNYDGEALGYRADAIRPRGIRGIKMRMLWDDSCRPWESAESKLVYRTKLQKVRAAYAVAQPAQDSS